MAPKKTAEGTWEIRWRDANGKPGKKRFKRHEDARQTEIRIKGEIQSGAWVDPHKGDLTLRQWADDWLTGAHNLRDNSKKIYKEALAHILLDLGDLRLNRITYKEIDKFLNTRLEAGAAPSSVHREFRTLRRMFKLAVERGVMPALRNPMQAVTEPRIPHEEMRFLDADELMLAAASIDWLSPGRGQPAVPIPERYRTLVLVGGWGGLRWGELAGLDVSRVDVTSNRVHVVRQITRTGKLEETKTKKSRRWVTLPEDVMAELSDHIKGRRTGPVWTMPQGGHLAQSPWRARMWVPAMHRAGLGAMERTWRQPLKPGGRRWLSLTYTGPTPHDLRHTSAALAIRAGAHPKAIQARLGHSSIRITLDLYGHLYPEMDAELAVALNEMMRTARPALRAV